MMCNVTLKEAMSSLRKLMETLTPEERIELMDMLMEGYCKECGWEYLPCHCTNDT